MMVKALAIVKTEEKTSKPKRERIVFIETRPANDWFVRAKTAKGRQILYLRFVLTGMHPRLYGPFPSKRQALLFLDDMINNLLDMLVESDGDCERRSVKEECQKIWPPLVEHPLIARRNSITRGR